MVIHFNDAFVELFPSVRSNSPSDLPALRTIPYGDELLDDHESEADLVDVPIGDIEKTSIILPSTWTGSVNEDMVAAAQSEIALRVAQAENALEGVRREIGHKSFLFRNNIALANNKATKTRGYSAIKVADAELRKHVQIYNQARHALFALKSSQEICERYKELKKDELRPLKSVYEPNARGQTRVNLAWFWTIQVGSDSDGSEYMSECECYFWPFINNFT